MPLKTLKNLPPGGWIYEQPGSTFKLNSMSPMMDAAKELSAFRVANNLPRASVEESTADIEEATCARLGYDPNWCYSPDAQKKIPNPANLFRAAATHVRGAVQRAAEGISKLDTGRDVLNSWVGDGLFPVPADLAQRRADICTGRIGGSPCPFNKEGAGFEAITTPIANAIRKQMEKKHEMKAVVVGEEKLFTCDQCWCNLPLKVWTPLKTILDRTPAPMLGKFASDAPHCWLVQEQKTPAT